MNKILMEQYLNYLSESPPPTEEHKNTVWYHGTRNAQVINDMILKPGNLHDEKSLKSFTPQYNRTYLTKDIEYALTYAYGGNFKHNSPETFLKGFKEKNTKPYVCVVYGNQLKDIEPDEDIIATFVQRIFYREEKRKDLTDIENRIAHYIQWNTNRSTLLKAIDDYGWGTKVGKTLLKKMPTDLKYDLIKWGNHIAEHGEVTIDEVWEMTMNVEEIKQLQSDPFSFKKYGKRIR